MINYLPLGVPARKKLDAIRGQLAKLTEELDELADAPVPVAEAVNRVLVAMDEQVREAADALGGFRSLQASAKLADLSPWALLRILHTEDQIRKALVTYFGNSDEAGIESASRPARIRKLREQVADLLSQEELETRRIEELGHTVERNDSDAVSAEVLLKAWDSR